MSVSLSTMMVYVGVGPDRLPYFRVSAKPA